MSIGLLKTTRVLGLCAAGCLATAVEVPQIGIQALGSWPTGSMREGFTANNGYGIGVFAGWEVGAGKALRLVYDGTWYQDEKHGVPPAGVPAVSLAAPDSERKFRSHALTAQYLFYPAEDTEGFYYKLGLGAMNYLTRVESTLVLPGPVQASVTTLEDSGIKLACLAGLGYDFSPKWGMLAQYSFITVRNHTLGGVQAGVSYRF